VKFSVVIRHLQLHAEGFESNVRAAEHVGDAAQAKESSSVAAEFRAAIAVLEEKAKANNQAH